MLKVSVIVPVYNDENFITECIESLLNQTLKEIEIIFVDDGSTDQTLDILNHYKKRDQRIKIISQKHKGAGAARNKGMAEAKGQYLSFLDADDFFEKDMLEKVYNRSIEESADITIFKVHFYHDKTGAITDDEAGFICENLSQKPVFNYKDMPDKIFNTFHNWTWNKIFLRKFILINKIEFQELFRTNDLLFTNKALILADKITTVEERLIYYRVRVSGNSQSTNYKNPYDFYVAFSELKEWLVNKGIYGAVRRSYQNHAIDACVYNLCTLEFGKLHEEMFYKLKEEILHNLDIDNMVDTQVYEQYKKNFIFERYQKICDSDFKDYLIYRGNVLKDEYLKLQFYNYNKVKELKQEAKSIYEAYEYSTTYKVGKIIMDVPIKLKKLLKKE